MCSRKWIVILSLSTIGSKFHFQTLMTLRIHAGLGGEGQCRENFWISIDLLKDFYGSKISLSGETFHAQKFMRRSGRVGGNIGPETLSISRDQSWKCSNENLNWLRCFCFPLTPDVFQLGEFALNFEENKSPADIWRSLTVCKPRHQRQHWSRIL